MYRNRLLLLATLLVTSLLITGCSRHKKPPPPKPDTSYKHEALVIGISDYAGEANDLTGIDKDIAKAKQLFQSWGFTTEVLSGGIDLESKLQRYADRLSADDIFILYYSGHGSNTTDHSGDELDGRDEQIVLSDGSVNKFILDDKINLMLNRIKARKLIVFDSCYSGTAIKRYVRNHQQLQKKFMPAPKSAADDAPENSTVPNTQMGGEYLYFAACQDNEVSLASPDGSLFTNAFSKNASLQKSGFAIYQQTLQELSEYFHPQILSSDPLYKNLSLKNYLKL